MTDDSPQPHRSRSRLVLGIFLLVLGAVLLAANLGYKLPIGWWQFFPIPFIALGLWGIVLPNRYLDRSGGVWLLAIGLYCLTGVFNLLGLGWTGGWPVFVIAAGLSFMLHRHIDGPGSDSTPPGPR
ncbi:MAG: LiaF transmembrane domain-containing protein [Steroidobacter sp.]